MTSDDARYVKVAEHYDRLASIGPYATVVPNNHGGRKAKYVSAVFDFALLRALRSDGKFERILDFGCGTGLFTQKVSALAEEVVGIDISTGILAQAEHLCRA